MALPRVDVRRHVADLGVGGECPGRDGVWLLRTQRFQRKTEGNTHKSLSSANGTSVVHPRALAPLVQSPTRLGQIVLGLFWLIDGLIQLQPYFFHHFAAGVIAPNAVGQPGLIGSPERGSAGCSQAPRRPR